MNIDPVTWYDIKVIRIIVAYGHNHDEVLHTKTL